MNLRTRAPWWRRAVRLTGRQLFRLAENNDDPRLESNGEQWLLRALLSHHAAVAKGRPFLACDGGANTGGYTHAILSAAGQAGCAAEVHAFEPSPHCIEILRRDFQDTPAVRVVGAALAERPGEASLHAGKAGSSQASLAPRVGLNTDPATVVTVPLLRLDDYLAAQSLACVDLLKLDVEGSELAALRGLGECLRPEVVDVIQFEYGGAALDAGTTLRELYGLLEGRGYVLAKLFPRALEVRSYRVWMEHYAYANYVALSPRWLAAGAAAR